MAPRLVFMGTPAFAVPTLTFLVQAGYPIAGVVTRPDRPRDRGHKLAFSPVKQTALDLGLPVLQFERLSQPEAFRAVAELQPQAVVVAAFGQILRTELLQLPPLGCLNVHASLLPKYRGAAPIQWALAQGETETGITVQKMVARLDAGDILVQTRGEIGPDETAPQLAERLAALGGPAVHEALQRLEADPRAGLPQDETQATLAPLLKKQDAWIDWNLRAEQVHDRVRGFQPWPGAATLNRGQRVIVLETRRLASGEVSVPPAVRPGELLRIDPELGWLVAAGAGTVLRVTRVQCDNTKPMTAQALSCGHAFSVGDVFGGREV